MENVDEANAETNTETVVETPQLYLPLLTSGNEFQALTAAEQAQVTETFNAFAAHVATLPHNERGAAMDVESRRIGAMYPTLRTACCFQRVVGGSCANPINPNLGQTCHQHRAHQTPHSVLSPVAVMGKCSSCSASPDAGSRSCTSCNHFLCGRCMSEVWTDDALEGEGTTVMLYCLTRAVSVTKQVRQYNMTKA